MTIAKKYDRIVHIINMTNKVTIISHQINKGGLEQQPFQDEHITTLAQQTLSNVSDTDELCHEFEVLPLPFSEISSNSPFADTDLVLFKDDYSGHMPLNGIKETELKETEELFKDIQDGKTQLEIDKTDIKFSYKVEIEIKKLLTRKIGRTMLSKVCQNSKKTLIVKSIKREVSGFSLEKTNPCYNENEGKLVHNIDHEFWCIGMTSSGKRGLFILPSYVILGHELIHASFPEKLSAQAGAAPSMEKEYDIFEEQVVITGLLKNLSFLVQSEEEWKSWIENNEYARNQSEVPSRGISTESPPIPVTPEENYHELNERNLTAAFITPSAPFYVRQGHGGIVCSDETNEQVLENFIYKYRVTAHPIMEKRINALKKQLSQINDLPAPVDFIVDCYLWLNTLSDQPASTKTLDFLLNNLRAAKTLDPKGLNQTILSFQKLKQFGDWKQEAIDELWVGFFNSLKENKLQQMLDSIPMKLKPIFDKLFKPYIENFNASSLILSSTIQEEFMDYLIQEKDPRMPPVENDDEESLMGGQRMKIENCESLLRLLFVKKSEQPLAQELICYLIKETKYLRDPSHFPMIFLRTLRNNFNIPLAKFFAPALKEAMKSFLQQILEGQEALYLPLFEDFFDHPEILMHDFLDRQRSYADIFLDYLSAHPEKISSLSDSQQKELVQKLKNNSKRL